MWKLRIGALITSGLVGLCLTPGAWADGGGDTTAGDVWLDNVKQPAEPGNEMDPHLACQDIDLWGSGLADSSGNFTVDGWSPSGSSELDYSGTWSDAQSGNGVIAVISVSKLIARAEADGDAAAAQGFHFKLQFSQDPQKQKTFWVDCPASSQAGAGSNGGRGGSTPPSGGTPSGGTTTSGSVDTPAVTTTSTGPVKTAISAVTIARKHPALHKRRSRRKLSRPARHHSSRRRHVKAVHLTNPAFTGGEGRQPEPGRAGGVYPPSYGLVFSPVRSSHQKAKECVYEP